MNPIEHGPRTVRLILGLLFVVTQVGCAGEPDLGPPPTSQAFRENAVAVSLEGDLETYWEPVQAFLVQQVGELVVIDEDLNVLVARRDDLVVTAQLRMIERGVTQVLLAARVGGGYERSVSDKLKRRMTLLMRD
ncbi:MAG: hypothetical protein V3T22_14415 [Planctomycetota bacterium]